MRDRWTLQTRLRNRAATPFFDSFGGGLEVPPGDAARMAGRRGNHRGEWRALGVVVPGVAGAAVFDALWRLGGPVLAWPGVLPATFLMLHLVSFVVGGIRPAAQWWRWELLLTGWALWQVSWVEESGVGWAAAFWLAVVALDLAGLAGRGWVALMTCPRFNTTRCRWWIAGIAHVPAVVLWIHSGWPAGMASLAVLAALWACGTFLPNTRVFGPVATKVEGDEMLLTIDDGPDPRDTPMLLDLLDRHGRKAVFFVIGRKVREFPELAREIVRRGHELGNHTMNHPAATLWGAGSVRTRREILECNVAIEEVTGVKPRWYRAPAGHRNWFTHPVLREAGLELVGWRKRGYDTVRRDVPRIVRRLTDDARAGDILLLHEATPIAKEVAEGVLRELTWRDPARRSGDPFKAEPLPSRSDGC